MRWQRGGRVRIGNFGPSYAWDFFPPNTHKVVPSWKLLSILILNLLLATLYMTSLFINCSTSKFMIHKKYTKWIMYEYIKWIKPVLSAPLNYTSQPSEVNYPESCVNHTLAYFYSFTIYSCLFRNNISFIFAHFELHMNKIILYISSMIYFFYSSLLMPVVIVHSFVSAV